MDGPLLVEAAKTFGIPMILVAGLVITTLREKKALSNRLGVVEDYQRNKMEKMITENTTAMTSMVKTSREISEINREQTQTLKQLTQSFRTRPCIAKDIDAIEQMKGSI